MFHQETLLLAVALAICRAYVVDKNYLYVPKAVLRLTRSLNTADNAIAELYESYSEQNYKCISEGRFEDPNDCGQYYDCIQTDTGELVAHKKSCLGLGFDTTIKACAQTDMLCSHGTVSLHNERDTHDLSEASLHDERDTQDRSEASLQDEWDTQDRSEAYLHDERYTQDRSEAYLHNERDTQDRSEASLHNERDTQDRSEASFHDEMDTQDRSDASRHDSSRLLGYKCKKSGGRCVAAGLCKTIPINQKCNKKGRPICCAKLKKRCTFMVKRRCSNDGGFCVKKRSACALGQIVSMCNCKGKKPGYCCVPAVCSEGFFNVPGSSKQCFKYFTDKVRTWYESKSKCQDEGLVLAKPLDPLALRIILVKKFGDTWAWIGAQGTGSYVKWKRDGTTIQSSSTLWRDGYPSGETSSTYCLEIYAYADAVENAPNQLYKMFYCSEASFTYALCESI